eukprot:765767-Hanusia_phi.AAC.17
MVSHYRISSHRLFLYWTVLVALPARKNVVAARCFCSNLRSSPVGDIDIWCRAVCVGHGKHPLVPSNFSSSLRGVCGDSLVDPSQGAMCEWRKAEAIARLTLRGFQATRSGSKRAAYRIHTALGGATTTPAAAHS